MYGEIPTTAEMLTGAGLALMLLAIVIYAIRLALAGAGTTLKKAIDWLRPAGHFFSASREDLPVVLGGLALVYAIVMATTTLVRERMSIWAVPMIALIAWREIAFAGMRVKLNRLRKQAPPEI